jgi:hypothetical protein
MKKIRSSNNKRIPADHFHLGRRTGESLRLFIMKRNPETGDQEVLYSAELPQEEFTLSITPLKKALKK